MQSETLNADYIIVGGGTAGLVVASRLSENPETKVLVLEAGDDLSGDPRVNIPALWTSLLGSDADWQYHTISQQGLGNRSIREPQGKALGGSSAINGQAFIAPAQAEIDAWADLGNPGWDWAGLVPWLKKSYTLLPPKDRETIDHLGIDWINDDFRGRTGPIKVSFPGVIENPLCKAWIDAFRKANQVTSGDPFSGNSIGGYSNAATVDPDTKTRSFAGTAYGGPLRHRQNARIILRAKTHKVIFSATKVSGNVRATGVLASLGGEDPVEFKASKEVVLAAGVFNTPKLLELSGIGNKVILENHGIPVIVNLPGVGENLQDHLMTGVSFEVNDGIVTGDALMRQEPEALALAQKLYLEHQAGPFTIGGTQSHAFMSTPDAEGVLALLDIPFHSADEQQFKLTRSLLKDPKQASAGWFMFLAQANLHQGGKSFVGTQLLPGNFASLGCSQSHPLSRGSSHISSNSIDAIPNIDPRYFDHPADLEVMARHVQALEKLRNSEELKRFFKTNGRRNHPDAFLIGELESAKKYVLDTATSTYHSCGTASMMPREQKGVVDATLRVHGFENLRVVDASIFPLIPRGNIMSTVYAVAEKAADLILNH